jgi:hypothetical protein
MCCPRLSARVGVGGPGPRSLGHARLAEIAQSRRDRTEEVDHGAGREAGLQALDVRASYPTNSNSGTRVTT